MNKVAVLMMWLVFSALVPTSCLAESPETEKSKVEQNKDFVLNIIQTYSSNSEKFRKNFCESYPDHPFSASTSVGRFGQLSAAEFCKRAMHVYPGSILNCYDCAGTWVSGSEKAIYSTGGLLQQEEIKFDSWKINVGYSHGRRYHLDNIIITVTDLPGINYVTLRYDDLQNAFGKKRRLKYSIQDIKLPDTASAVMVSTLQSPAIKISQNELITLLNRAYLNYPYGLYDFAVELVTNQQFRRDVIHSTHNK